MQMKPQMKRDIVTSVLVGIGAFVIMMAIALASPNRAHAESIPLLKVTIPFGKKVAQDAPRAQFGGVVGKATSAFRHKGRSAAVPDWYTEETGPFNMGWDDVVTFAIFIAGLSAGL